MEGGRKGERACLCVYLREKEREMRERDEREMRERDEREMREREGREKG